MPRRNIAKGEYVTVVDVVLDSEGNLLGLQYLQRSGIPEFDQSVEESWKRIRRFPNPPKGLLKEDGNLHMGWTFAVQVGDGNQEWDFRPPERRF
jgi:TonB family protein